MRYSVAAKNLMLDALDEAVATGAKFASLHTDYSSTGANELSGGSPAYARKAVGWNAAAAGAKLASAPITFDVGAGSVVRYLGLWDAVTGGNFLAMTPSGGTLLQQFVVPDTAADVLECAAHGFANGDTVVVWAGSGDPLPTPLAEGTVYYVISATADDLQLSLTAGGASVAITAIGAGLLQKIVPETFNAQGTHTMTAVTLAID